MALNLSILAAPHSNHCYSVSSRAVHLLMVIALEIAYQPLQPSGMPSPEMLNGLRQNVGTCISVPSSALYIYPSQLQKHHIYSRSSSESELLRYIKSNFALPFNLILGNMQHHKTSMILLSAAISIYAEFTSNLTPVSGSTFALQPSTAKLGSSTTISGAATTPTLLFDPPTTTLTR